MDNSTSIVKKILEHQGITVNSFSKVLGIKQPSLWCSLNRGKGLGAENLARMLDALGYDLQAVPRGGGIPYTIAPRNASIDTDVTSDKMEAAREV